MHRTVPAWFYQSLNPRGTLGVLLPNREDTVTVGGMVPPLYRELVNWMLLENDFENKMPCNSEKQPLV